MHEMSIAMDLIQLVEDESARLGVGKVSAVHLRVGALSGVVPDALMFSYQLAREDTALAAAELKIETVPVVIRCTRCGRRRAPPSIQDLGCPECVGARTEVVEGLELDLEGLEIQDDDGSGHGAKDRTNKTEVNE